MANGSLPNSEAVKKIEKQGVLAAPSAKSITYQDKTYKEKDYTHQPMSSSFSDVTKHTLMHDPMSTPIPSVLNIDHINESQDNETPNLHVSIPTPGTLQQHLPTWLKPDSGSSLPVRRFVVAIVAFVNSSLNNFSLELTFYARLIVEIQHF